MNALPRWREPALRSTACCAATVVVVTALGVLCARARIVPVIIADNATIFLATDRLCDGLGLTATPPKLPLEAWDWARDWTFMTRWPAGFPLILYAARMLLGVGSAQAAIAISVLCCGVALVGWFVLVRRCLPRRLPATLIALLAAGSTLTLTNLVRPSGDTVLLAALPLVLMLAWWALGWQKRTENTDSADPCGQRSTVRGQGEPAWARLVVFGLAAGALVWVRYAAAFVPLGISVFLAIEWLWYHRVRFVHVAVFGLAASAPILALAGMNRAWGDDLPVQQQYPVGGRLSLDVDAEMFATAWHRFTQQTFYHHRPEAAWFFAVAVPLGGLVLPFALRSSRRWMAAFVSSPPLRLCVSVTAACLIMLLVMSAVFRERFHFVGLDRYYTPIRPFYYLFFIGPIAALGSRTLRVLACIPLLLAGSWLVQQDWVRTYRRVLARPGAVTPYGRRAVYFEPHSAALYEWLKARRSDHLLVLSNFHDEIALETRIPACPTPRDRAELETWIARVKRARAVNDLRVLFVLDPDNHGRRYFLLPPAELVERFELCPVPDVPERIAPYVYECAPTRQVARNLDTVARPEP